MVNVKKYKMFTKRESFKIISKYTLNYVTVKLIIEYINVF